MSELGIDLTQDQQNARNAIDLSNKDGIEIVSPEAQKEIEEEIHDIKREVPVRQEIKPVEQPTVSTPAIEKPIEKTDFSKPVEQIIINKPVEHPVDENVEHLNAAYKEYYDAINQLPAGLLDNINRSYMALERSIAAIPKDILFKFTKSFESIDDDIPRIFLNPNDFGSSNYSFIIEKSKIYYDFFTTVPYQMINNLLTSYEEYAKYYKLIPNNMFDYIVNTYREYKKCLSYVSPESIKSLGYDKVDSIFLNRVMLYEENMTFLLKDIAEEEILSDVRYGITNDTHVDSDHFIIIPSISREDFIGIVNQTGSLDRANDICARHMEVVYNSVDRVKDSLVRDNAILENIRANMEISTMFIGLAAKNKENILNLIGDQIKRRDVFIARITMDLKNGWNKIDGQIGSVMDDDYDDSDYFNKLESVSECAKGYSDMLNDLMSLHQIVNLVKENGYNIK